MAVVHKEHFEWGKDEELAAANIAPSAVHGL